MPRRLVDLKKRYGFERPFDFSVVIPLLLSALGLVAVLIASTFLFSTAALSIGTQRFYFFCYIIVLLVVAGTFSRNTPLSVTILAWCALELSLALSSSALQPAGITLFPDNIYTAPRDSRFVYHPLLQRVPKPNWQESIRYDRRNESEGWLALSNERYYDQNFVFVHNSLGLRGTEPTPNDLRKPLIYFYGGSSTYDYTVTQGDTWVERLQSELNGEFTLLNFGVPAQNTTEHLIHTVFYQNILDKRPVCAVYYVGFNELGHIPVEDFGLTYTNYHALLVAVRKHPMWAAKYSPAARLANIAAARRFDSLPEPARTGENTQRDDIYRNLERLFIEHVNTLVAVNNSRSIRTVFIGQMMNRDLLDALPESPFFLVPEIANRDVWPLVARLNTVLQNTSNSLGANYIDPGIENFNDGDFTDLIHFSATGSSKFATLISKEIDTYCSSSE